MKIGIEVQRLFRKEKFGIETSALQLIKKLQELESKHEYFIFVKDDVNRGCLEESANLKIRTLSGKFFIDFEQFFLPLAVRREKLDLLHCTGNTAPYFSSVPVVQTLHDIIFMDPIPRNDSLYQRFGNHYRRKIVPMVTPRSEVVITVSNYEKERIASRLGIPESKIKVIYNGINERFHIYHDQVTKEKVRTKYQLPHDFLLFLGNPTSRKNPYRVIEAYVMYAAKTERPLPLVTPGLPRRFITNYLKMLGLEDYKRNFVTPGYIDDEDLPHIYGMSKLFLFPSLSEGFGMPAIEAMACGTPVITSKISSMPEIAADAAILVDPLSAPSISEALTSLLTNEDLRNEKIQDGLINAKRFSWTRCAESVIEVYDRILHSTKNTQKNSSEIVYDK